MSFLSSLSGLTTAVTGLLPGGGKQHNFSNAYKKAEEAGVLPTEANLERQSSEEITEAVKAYKIAQQALWDAVSVQRRMQTERAKRNNAANLNDPKYKNADDEVNRLRMVQDAALSHLKDLVPDESKRDKLISSSTLGGRRRRRKTYRKRYSRRSRHAR